MCCLVARSCSQQSHPWAHSGRGAPLERSLESPHAPPLRGSLPPEGAIVALGRPGGSEATALRCSGVGRAAELATRCALRSNNRSEHVHGARWRAPTLPFALLGAPEARPNRCAPTGGFAVPMLARQSLRATFCTGLRWAPWGGGDLCGGEKRRAGGGTRSVLRQHARRSCLSVARKARAASSAALPRHEHRSGVGAQRPPPQCEPLHHGVQREPASSPERHTPRSPRKQEANTCN